MYFVQYILRTVPHISDSLEKPCLATVNSCLVGRPTNGTHQVPRVASHGPAVRPKKVETSRDHGAKSTSIDTPQHALDVSVCQVMAAGINQLSLQWHEMDVSTYRAEFLGERRPVER